MSLVDFSLPGSDPTTPNSFVETPQQTAYQLELARQLMQKGSDYSPVQSPWQGAARLVQGLVGGLEMGQAQRTQRAGLADALASYGNSPQVRALGYDPAEANIPDTPGQTTPALAANDALVDRLSDAQDRTQPAGGGAPSGGVNTALAPLDLSKVNTTKTMAVPARASQPQAQQQPPVQGARQAPDGNWYVADPNRPGKYLMVHGWRPSPPLMATPLPALRSPCSRDTGMPPSKPATPRFSALARASWPPRKRFGKV
jgi:hypothetical protein